MFFTKKLCFMNIISCFAVHLTDFGKLGESFIFSSFLYIRNKVIIKLKIHKYLLIIMSYC